MGKKERSASIDLLKGLAMFAIVLCHVSQITFDKPKVMNSLISLGQFGCQFFFFITGWLSFKSFDVKLPDYEKYLLNKVKKILFPWYVVVFVYLTISMVLAKANVDFPYITSFNFADVLINILFLNGLFPCANNNVVLGGWYIGTLVLIWLLLPLIAKFVVGKDKPINRLVAVIVCCFVLMGCVDFVIGPIKNNSFFYFSFVNQLPCVLLGGVAFYYEKNHDLPQSVKILLSIFCFCLGAMFKFFPYNLVHVFSPFLISVASATVLSLCIHVKTKGLVTKFFVFIGENSLFIYLTHVFIAFHVQYFFRKIFFDTNATFFFVIYSLVAVPFVVCLGLALKQMTKYTLEKYDKFVSKRESISKAS